MSERVASLYAEIGGKTDGLKTALSEVKSSLTSAKAELGDLATASKTSTRAVDTHFDNMADSITANLNSSKSAVDSSRASFERFSSGVRSSASGAATGVVGLGRQTVTALKDAGAAWNKYATNVNQTLEILGKVGRAAQQAYQFVSEGVGLAATRDTFDALAGSINTTGDALLGKLKEATRGTVSDFKLMESASSLMNLKLVETQEEAVRMGAVAGKLNWDMSVLALTIANKSTMRLDNLGLSMEDVTSRARALEKQGLSTDEAFKFAIIEAGEAKLLLVGDAADRAAGKLKILETNAANAGDNFKASFSEELINQLNDISHGLFETADGASSAGAAIGTELAQGITNVFVKMNPVKLLMDYNIGFLKLIGVVDDSTEAHDRGREAMVQFNQSIAANNAIIERGAGLYDDRREAIESHNDAMRAARQYTYDQSDAAAEFDDKLIQSSYHLSEQEAAILRANIAAGVYSKTTATVTGAIYASSEAVAAYNATTGDYATMAIQAQEQGLDLNQVMYDAADAAGANAAALVGIKLALGEITPAQAEYLLQQAAMVAKATEFGEAIAAGTMTISEAVTGLQTFSAGLMDTDVNINAATGSVYLFDDSITASSASTQNLLDKMGMITDVNAVVTVDTGDAEARVTNLYNKLREIGDPAMPTGGGSSGGGSSTSTGAGGGYQAPGAAAGANYIVPPGYNENWYQPVSSGEHVQVTPAGQQSGGGDTYNLYITPANPDNVIQSFNYMKAISGG